METIKNVLATSLHALIILLFIIVLTAVSSLVAWGICSLLYWDYNMVNWIESQMDLWTVIAIGFGILFMMSTQEI